jgi:hypothetical protein
MIQVENITFVKIKTRYINKKFYLDDLFSQNDCIFKFNNNVKEFSKTWIFFYIILKALVCMDIQTSYKLKQKLGMF